MISYYISLIDLAIYINQKQLHTNHCKFEKEILIVVVNKL